MSKHIVYIIEKNIWQNRIILLLSISTTNIVKVLKNNKTYDHSY